MTAGGIATDAILLVGRAEPFRERARDWKLFEAPSVKRAERILKKQTIKVIISSDVSNFEKLKIHFPDPVRILFVDQLNIDVTQSAINRGEVFRFVEKSSSSEEILEAINQGIKHFDIVTRHQHLLGHLKTQNIELEKMIQKLEKEVNRKTMLLKSVEGELHSSKRHLEQLNTLIAWINASTTMGDLQHRVEQAMKGVLPVEKIILSESAHEAFVKKIKELKRPTVVVPLVYQKKKLGHLYFICRDEVGVHRIYEKLDLVKQVSDTVALTLEKIHIFEISVKRKEEWEKTFDAIKDPVSLVNQHYEIVRANLAYSQISEIKIQDLARQKCYQVFQKRNSPCEGCLLVEALRGRKHKNFELKSLAQDTYYATSSFPIAPYDQGVMYYRNQGEERGLRDQLIQSEKMAEIGILAGSVAHELNNPLGGILAFSQILLSEVLKESVLYEDLKEIEKAALRSKNIIENLLYFSRASSQKERENIDINVIIEKALSLLDFQIRHKNIHVYKKTSSIPSVRGDFNQLVQVFLNLFQNSIEALKKNGSIEISSEYVKSEQKIMIEIKDNGMGVPPRELSKIFDPFFTTKNKIHHSGLGLSVGYRIIKDHGGDLKAESTLGEGAKFIVTLPLGRDHAALARVGC